MCPFVCVPACLRACVCVCVYVRTCVRARVCVRVCVRALRRVCLILTLLSPAVYHVDRPTIYNYKSVPFRAILLQVDWQREAVLSSAP